MMSSNLATVALSHSPMFVVGAPRSGTTLVAKIMDRHPDVASLGESHFFEDIWARRVALGDLSTEEELKRAAERALTLFGRFEFPKTQHLVEETFTKESLVDDAKMHGGGYAGLYYALMAGLANALIKKRFCDDTPKHLFYLNTLLDLFPEARVIACVRDPRDFLGSYKNYWKRMTCESEVTRMRSLYNPVLTSLLWRSSANSITRWRHDPRVRVLRYEDLVTSPDAMIGSVCNFLGLEYSADLLQVESHNSSYEQQTSSGIYATSVGRWRSALTPEELWCVQTLNRGPMSNFDYAIHRTSPSIPRLARILLSTPADFVRAVRVNTDRRGPVLEYVRRRAVALLGRSKEQAT